MFKNEKKTEKLTRDFLLKVGIYGNDNFIIEEQKSDNPKIQKLLQKASKSGEGVGRPEFIITKKDNDNYLIVIECKADPKYHASSDRDQYRDFAVDGVLLYASCLSKDFNVIAIAISGQTEPEIKIDTFLHPKGVQFAAPLKDSSEKRVLVKEIVGWQDYVRYAQYDENLVVARKNDLSRFSKDLHNYLRDYGKITVAQMPLLVSGVLIALMEKGFKVAYSEYEGQELAQKTFRALKDEINKILQRRDQFNQELKDLEAKSASYNQQQKELQHSLSRKNKELQDLQKNIDSFKKKNNIESYIPNTEWENALKKTYEPLEKKMKGHLKSWTKFTHKEVTEAEAKEHFKDNPYKIELIEEIIKKGEKITLYTCGNFTDLCRGGHAENPAKESVLNVYSLEITP